MKDKLKIKNRKGQIPTRFYPVLIIGVLLFMMYMGWFGVGSIYSFSSCAQIRSDKPNENFGCYNGGVIQAGRPVYVKYEIPSDVSEKVKSGEYKLVGISIDDFLSRSNYGDKILGIYSTSNDWKPEGHSKDITTIRWNNAPSRENRIGSAFRPKYGVDGLTSSSKFSLSPEFSSNLALHISNNIALNEKYFSIVLVQESLSNNFGDYPPKIDFVLEKIPEPEIIVVVDGNTGNSVEDIKDNYLIEEGLYVEKETSFIGKINQWFDNLLNKLRSFFK